MMPSRIVGARGDDDGGAEAAEDDEGDPQFKKSELPREISELPLVDRVVAVPLFIEVEIGERHQAEDDHAR